MPVVSLLPTVVGAYDAWTLGAGASKPIACQSNDGDGSYITSDHVVTRNQTFAMDDLPSDAVGVTTVDHVRSRRATSATVFNDAYMVRLSGVDQVGTATSPGTGYVITTEPAIGRPGGGAWSVADVNALEAGGQSVTSGDPNEKRYSLVRLDVTYVPAAGGFCDFIGSLIGPTVAGLMLREMPHVARAAWLASRGRWLLLPREYAAAFRELRDGRFARHFLMEAA